MGHGVEVYCRHGIIWVGRFPQILGLDKKWAEAGFAIYFFDTRLRNFDTGALQECPPINDSVIGAMGAVAVKKTLSFSDHSIRF